MASMPWPTLRHSRLAPEHTDASWSQHAPPALKPEGPALPLSCSPALRLSCSPALRLSCSPALLSALLLSGSPALRLSCSPALPLSCSPALLLSGSPALLLSSRSAGLSVDGRLQGPEAGGLSCSPDAWRVRRRRPCQGPCSTSPSCPCPFATVKVERGARGPFPAEGTCGPRAADSLSKACLLRLSGPDTSLVSRPSQTYSIGRIAPLGL